MRWRSATRAGALTAADCEREEAMGFASVGGWNELGSAGRDCPEAAVFGVCRGFTRSGLAAGAFSLAAAGWRLFGNCQAWPSAEAPEACEAAYPVYPAVGRVTPDGRHWLPSAANALLAIPTKLHAHPAASSSETAEYREAGDRWANIGGSFRGMQFGMVAA